MGCFPVGENSSSATCNSLPQHAYQLTARSAHALRVQLKPTLPPTLPGFAFDALSRPAAFVGGDYFSIEGTRANTVGVLMFDVCGKGPEAALVAARLQTLFRVQANGHRGIKDVLTRVNDALQGTLPLGRFATALYGVLNPDKRSFTFARAGHEPLVLARAGHTETQAPQGLPLGIVDREEFADLLEVETVSLETNDRLFLFTDGLTEARNCNCLEFGLERVLSELRTSDGDDINAVTLALSNFVRSTPQHDDLTMLSIRAL